MFDCKVAQHLSRAITVMLLSLGLGLAGCGGEDSGYLVSGGDAVNPSGGGSVAQGLALVVDGFSTVRPGVESSIDLSRFMLGDNVRVTAVDVVGDGDGCGRPVVSGRYLNLVLQPGSFCQYQYTGSQAGLESGEVKFDLAELLRRSKWKDSYSLLSVGGGYGYEVGAGEVRFNYLPVDYLSVSTKPNQSTRISNTFLRI